MYILVIKFIKKKILRLKIFKVFYSFFLAIKIEIKLFNQNKIILVYDCKNTPPTYGDFSYFIFLIRFLRAKNKNAKLIIINGDYRQDWDVFSSQRKKIFIYEILNLAKFYSSRKTVYLMNWEKFQNILKNKKKQILFFNKIKNRKKIYDNIFNTLQILYFLNKKIWKHIQIKSKFKNCFAVHFRYQAKSILFKKKYNSQQNNSFIEAKKIINFLIKKHSKLNCIIFTNEDGARFFKNLKKISKKIKFSKEVSSNFLNDIKILCDCKFYYSFKGGGMGVFPKFSNIKYLVGQKKLGNEVQWSRKYHKIAPWSLQNQRFVVNKNISVAKYLAILDK